MLKRYLLSLALMLGLAYGLLAQVPVYTRCCISSTLFNEDASKRYYYCAFPEVEPSYRGGPDSLKTDIEKYLKYPCAEEELGIRGKVFLELVISSNGKVLQKTVLRGLNTPASCNYDKAALAVVEHLNKWIPAKCHSRFVTAKTRFIVTFK